MRRRGAPAHGLVRKAAPRVAASARNGFFLTERAWRALQRAPSGTCRNHPGSPTGHSVPARPHSRSGKLVIIPMISIHTPTGRPRPEKRHLACPLPWSSAVASNRQRRHWRFAGRRTKRGDAEAPAVHDPQDQGIGSGGRVRLVGRIGIDATASSIWRWGSTSGRARDRPDSHLLMKRARHFAGLVGAWGTISGWSRATPSRWLPPRGQRGRGRGRRSAAARRRRRGRRGHPPRARR